LVTKRGLRIAAVVELDDKTHLDSQQQARDAYLADALHAAGVPLIRFPVYQRYDVAKLRAIAYGAIRRASAAGSTRPP
jgi:very-short-patch-repair endonuclease